MELRKGRSLNQTSISPNFWSVWLVSGNLKEVFMKMSQHCEIFQNHRKMDDGATRVKVFFSLHHHFSRNHW